MTSNQRKQRDYASCSVITLRKSEIPEYLKRGQLFRKLMENNDNLNEEITFPVHVMKLDTTVNNAKDLNQLLSSLRYWGAEAFVFKEIIAYILLCRDKSLSDVLKMYEDEFKYLRWLRHVHEASPALKMSVAIESGIVELVQQLASLGLPLPPNACDLAATFDNLDLMMFLRNQWCNWSTGTGDIAAWHGNIALLAFMSQNGYVIDPPNLLAAIRGGHLRCVQYIYSSGYAQIWHSSFSSEECNIAAQRGYEDILHFLHDKRFRWGADTTAAAASGGHIHCLQYLHENCCEWNSTTCQYAAREGHLTCLKYAREHGCPIDNSAADLASTHGHLKCLKYAHAHGCKWTYIEDKYIQSVYFQCEFGKVQRSRPALSTNVCWDYLRRHASNLHHYNSDSSA